MTGLIKTLIFVVIVGALSAGGWYWYRSSRNAASATQFRTAEVKRGDLTATISATGTVEPEEAIDVAQVQGRITGFGKDKDGKPVDNNSEVEEGMVLAMIDPLVYQAQVDQAQAQLKQANAAVDRAVADLGQMEATLNKASRDWDRAQKLGPSDALSQSDYDQYETAFVTATANIGVGKAAIEQARASVAQNEAALKQAKQNLTYCTITAPVNGVVITRRVNIGQTVVSSLSAPSLFLIAKDLTKLVLWTSVNEADIGSVRVGQDVSFTVDAHPNRKFKGTVTKVRMDAQMNQNVVTYTVEVTTDNSDSALIPYLTANVAFQVGRKENTLLVPNSALRWSPSQPDQISPDSRGSMNQLAGAGSGDQQRGGNRQNAPTTNPAAAQRRREQGGHYGTVWIEDGKFAKPLRVQLGLTDGTNTELQSDEIKEGTRIINGETAPGAGGDEARNPFAPQMPRGRGR